MESARSHLNKTRKLEHVCLAAMPMDQEQESSHEQVLLNVALATARSAPDIRTDRLEALRAQIDSGTYQIDSLAIAKALVAENPELFKP